MTPVPYDFGLSLKHWARIPVDDFDYLDARELVTMHPDQLLELVDIASSIRWSPNQWRNLDHGLERFMELGRWQGKLVMDFGTGLGIDSIAFTRAGAGICMVDLHPWTLYCAQKVLNIVTGYSPVKLCVAAPAWPYVHAPKIDLFWSLGVLHHFPYAGDLLKRVCQLLNPGGEIRILLYSDIRWTEMTGTEPPTGPVHKHPKFEEFTRKCDAVGVYADFYNDAKIKNLVKDFAEVTETRYLSNNQFLGAVIKPKEYAK
jgi:SAM-dependent methyltransferase